MSDATNTPAPPAEAPKPTPPHSAPNASESDPVKLPDDHPLVTALAAQKAKNQALEEKARRLDEIEEAQKSEAEKAADALATAQSEAQSAKAELMRYQVAARHGITDADDIALFLTGTDEDTLKKQATRLAERTSTQSSPRTPRPDPNQGRSGSSPASPADLFAATLQQSLNS